MMTVSKIINLKLLCITVGILINKVKTSCVISPNLTSLTIRDTLIQDVELHCQCMDDNGIFTGTRWFLPDMTTIVSTDSSNRPYSTGTASSTLIITGTFTNSDTGTYTCSPNNTFPNIPPGDDITLNTATPRLTQRSCTIFTSLPTLTAPGGVIANGMQNVTLYCICVEDNIAVGPTTWFFNGAEVTLTQDDGNSNPYSRNNVPSPLIIPSFISGNDGNYSCETQGNFISSPNNTIILTLPISTPNVAVTAPNVQTVGQSLILQCEVTTVRGITSRVDIVWSSGGTVLQRMNNVSSTMMNNSLVYTTSYTISQLSTTDNGRVIQCEVVINVNPPVMASDNLTLNVTVPTPRVIISPSGFIQGAAVGSFERIKCILSTVGGVESSSVMISWMGPGGSTIMNNARITIGPITFRGNTYTENLQFEYLAEGDNGTYTCNVMILDTSNTQSLKLQSLIVPIPSVAVTALSTQTAGQSLTLQCEVTAVRGITSRVDIVWSSGSMELQRMDNVSLIAMNNSLVYTDSYTISQLNVSDNGFMIQCEVVINANPVIIANDNITLNVTVPTPYVAITTPSTQIVGQSLTLQCEVTTVRAIDVGVDIVWSSDDGELQRINNTTPTTMGSSLVYRDNYTILLLNTSDEDRVIQCTVVIDSDALAMATSNTTLNVTVPTPIITISPSGPIQGAMVGNPQVINCTVSTVSGVEFSSVMISWMGPGGIITMNNTRVTISPTISSGNTYTSCIHLTYLAEGDEGIYACNVMILETNAKNSTEIENLSIPTPSITINTLNAQMVGQSLTLQCNVTTVRGITSRVDIVWRSGGTELQRMNDVPSTMMSNSLVYADSYTISLLSTTDDGRVIQCEVLINTNPIIMANNSFTLNVTVPTPTVTISPFVPIRGAMVGSPQIINCTVSTVSGVESSSVMISWMGPRGSITNDSRLIIIPTTSSSNTYTSSLQFTYLMEGDEGTYTCNVMILDTSGSQSVELHSLTVPTPTINAFTLNNNQILGQSLILQCEVIAVRGITSRVDIVWSGGGMELQRMDNVSSTTMNNSLVYTDSYTISQVNASDSGVVIQCEAVINANPMIFADDNITLNVTVPTPTVNAFTLNHNQTVGQSLTLQCEVTTVRGITSRLDIVWSSGGMELQRMDNVSSTTMNNSLVFTHSYTISQLNASDSGVVIQCEAVINANPVIIANDNVTLNVTVPTPSVALTAPNNQTVGQPLTLQCEVTTVRGIDIGVDIVWSSDDGELQTINNTTPTTTDNTFMFKDNYTILLSTSDEDRVIRCEVVINLNPLVMASNITTLNVTVPTPGITISPSGPIQGAMVGSLQIINCTVSTVSGVESSSVMISWIGPRGIITMNNTRMTISATISSGNSFTSSLQITYLREGDEGKYTCDVMILETNAENSTEMGNFSVPIPSVAVTALNNQTVGQSLTLQCEVTTVRGITSRMDIVWSSGGTELQRMNNVSSTMMSNLLVYTNSYTISQLSTTDDGRGIQCEAVINVNPVIMANDSFTLNVAVPTPTVTISPSFPMQGAMLGSPQVINCTVSTVSGVESSSVMISWMGPGGSITNDSRVIIIPTTSSSNTYTSSLQYTYLMEGDEGTYTCNVKILDTSGSQSVELQSLTVPTPNVNVTAPNNQAVGQSLTLQCEVTTVKGITSRVDIVWSSGGTELQRMNDVSSTMMSNSLVYTNSYTISQLSTTDDGRVIQCGVVINADQHITDNDVVTLDVTVPAPIVILSPSGPIQGAVVGNPQDINCTVNTVSGVESSSVMISWIRPGGDTVMSNARITVNPTTSRGNAYTSNLQFAQLMEGDEGTYTCNVMILDTSESQSVALLSLTVLPPKVSISPTEVTSRIGAPVSFYCSATGVDSSDFVYQWSLNDFPIPGQDTQILAINNVSEQDTGEYRCFVRNSNGEVGQSELARLISNQFCAPVTVEYIGFNITWNKTSSGVTVKADCTGPNLNGIVRRRCIIDDSWEEYIECFREESMILRNKAINLSTLNDTERIAQAGSIANLLVNLTTPTQEPALAEDISLAVNIVSILNNVTGSVTNLAADDEIFEDIITVIDNLLSEINRDSWEQLQRTSSSTSQSLLIGVEQVTRMLGETLNSDATEAIQIRENIVVKAELVSYEDMNAMYMFPDDNDNLANYTNRRAQVMISNDLLQVISRDSEELIILGAIIRNGDILRLPSGTAIFQSPTSPIFSLQIDPIPVDRDALVNNPIMIIFDVEAPDTISEQNNVQSVQQNFTINDVSCNFYDYSLTTVNNLNQIGGWSTEGLTVDRSQSNETSVTCITTHLTSFAILVSIQDERPSSTAGRALSIISYIGCAISLICLCLSILILSCIMYKAEDDVNHLFVHLNLCIALAMGLIVFIAGMEQATENKAACKFIAALLQYLFISAFCWMLCEGVMLYMMLVTVFGNKLNKRSFFFFLGWGPAIPIVAISVGTAHEHYGTDQYCWITSDDGAIAAFIVPIVVIILINCVFLTIALKILWINRKNKRLMRGKANVHRNTVKDLLKGSIILLPLLGITWIIGILAVNEETQVFAWIFAIFNSLQGTFIFIFHVLRNLDVAKRIKERYATVWSNGISKATQMGTNSGNKSTQTSQTTLSKDGDHNGKTATTSFGSSTIGKDYSSVNLDKPEDITGTLENSTKDVNVSFEENNPVGGNQSKYKKKMTKETDVDITVHLSQDRK